MVNQVGLTGNSRNARLRPVVITPGGYVGQAGRLRLVNRERQNERDNKAKPVERPFLRLLQQLRRRRFIYDQLIH
jgi:hypothetical protein